MSNRKNNSATARLKQDYLSLLNDPIPYITAHPVPSNILEWHYVVSGLENTPYKGGYYHGKIIFPKEFPFSPPAIFMLTPSGRFIINKGLCMSISDYHPETWSPAWSVSTILKGLLSFMNEKSMAIGSIETSDNKKRQLAYESLEYNLKNDQFKDLFPDIAIKIKKVLLKRKNSQKQTDLSNPKKQTNTDPSSVQICLNNLSGTKEIN